MCCIPRIPPLFPAGVVTFKDLANGNVVAPQIRISYFFTGLKPGPHSMHVHTYGDISSGDIAYVGGHYEGDGNAVRPGVVSKKVAYLQNGFPIVADKDGNAVGSFMDTTVGLLDGDNSVVGRSIVLHSPVDGSKIAQGVIGLSSKHSLGGGFFKESNAPDWLVDAAEVVNHEGNDGEGRLTWKWVASDTTALLFLWILVVVFG